MIELRARVRESNPRVVRPRPREQADTQIGREIVGHDELRVDAARCPPLIESRDDPGRMMLPARRFQERDELGDRRLFVWRDRLLG